MADDLSLLGLHDAGWCMVKAAVQALHASAELQHYVVFIGSAKYHPG
jgi:hypothetical protein